MHEIKKIAFSDIRNLMRDGKVLLPEELDADTARAVQSFEIDEYGRIKYKFWDKNAALEKASKILGLYELDNKQKMDPLASLLAGLAGNVISVNYGKEPGENINFLIDR